MMVFWKRGCSFRYRRAMMVFITEASSTGLTAEYSKKYEIDS